MKIKKIVMRLLALYVGTLFTLEVGWFFIVFFDNDLELYLNNIFLLQKSVIDYSIKLFFIYSVVDFFGKKECYLSKKEFYPNLTIKKMNLLNINKKEILKRYILTLMLLEIGFFLSVTRGAKHYLDNPTFFQKGIFIISIELFILYLVFDFLTEKKVFQSKPSR